MELPWSNLLAMANAMTGTPWLFFVLYLHVSLDLTLFQMGLLMAYLYLLRWMANNTVLYLFDRLSRHYSMFLILFCTLVGLSGLLVFIVLSSYSSLLVGVMDSGCYWYIVFGVMTLFGAFYLSLGVLVESVILKSWGEYRMYFYGKVWMVVRRNNLKLNTFNVCRTSSTVVRMDGGVFDRKHWNSLYSVCHV
jgi:hypothetical protein